MNLWKDAGVVVSVSFASAARAEFLRRVADELRMDLKLAVIGDGDPKFGNLVHFVSVLGFHLKRDVPEFSRPDDELTRTVARRVARARSVIEDEPPSADDARQLADAPGCRAYAACPDWPSDVRFAGPTAG